MRTHGLPATYVQQGCRCQDCTTAHSQWCLSRRRHRRERLAAKPSLATHGSVSTYRNWDCRCAECTAANSAACAAYERRRRAVSR